MKLRSEIGLAADLGKPKSIGNNEIVKIKITQLTYAIAISKKLAQIASESGHHYSETFRQKNPTV